jgi:hypothetical protein
LHGLVASESECARQAPKSALLQLWQVSWRRRTPMPVAATLATPLPGRLEWHPLHGEPRAGDPETFHLHVEFVNAHGLPKGQFTTFSTCNQTQPAIGRSGGVGAHNS